MSDWEKISDLVENVQSGKTTALEMVNQAIANIDLNQEFAAIVSDNREAALTRAKELDAAKEKKGRLYGVPFIAKDNFLTFGTDTTASSNILKGFKAPYQATVIEKLEAEGAIMVAKANLDAFAHGSSTENSDFGPTLNPHDKGRVPGGSSGGSAASVVLGLAPFALGTDTGGSIRLPASFTGSVGYKPTYGLVSRYGVIAMASSTDVIGPLTTNVEDAALILDIIAGEDWKDSTTVRREDSYVVDDAKITDTKFGLIFEYMGEGLNSDVQKVIENSAAQIKNSATVDEISIPTLNQALAAYYVIAPAEISSNLARYDGIKFGYSHQNSDDLDQVYDLSRSKGFGYEAKRRIMIGAYVLSSGYYDAYYKKAQQVRTLIIKGFEKAFENHDLLIGPVAPDVAFKIGDNTQDPMKMYLADIMTVGVSLAGLPAISVPVGNVGNLPVGLQIIGPQGADRKVLEAARAIEELFNV